VVVARGSWSRGGPRECESGAKWEWVFVHRLISFTYGFGITVCRDVQDAAGGCSMLGPKLVCLDMSKCYMRKQYEARIFDREP
jgi:hypothetical protein